MRAVGIELGKMGISEGAGAGTQWFLEEKLGADRLDALLAGLAMSTMTYAGLNRLQGNVVERYRVNDEIPYENNGDNKSKILSTSEAEEYAFNAIKGPNNADSVVLGKYESNSDANYDTIAKDMGAQYFNLDDWDELSTQYSREEI